MELIGIIGMLIFLWVAIESIVAIGYLAINGFRF